MGRTANHWEDEPLRIELYVRRNAFGARTRQQRVFERVRRLEGHPEIENMEVRRWPDRIAADERGEFVGVIREFERWAADHERSLAPCFERREVTPGFTDERFEQVVLPIICLAVYRGERLRNLAPHVDGRHPYTVDDCIADLEERLEERDGPALSSDRAVPL